jgi:hypothetical protein
MQRLREALLGSLPGECFLNGSSISASGRAFSIKLDSEEQVLAAQLDHPAMKWRRDQLRCDALFFCLVPMRNELLVALVELKGKDVKHAMKQIQASSQALCNRTRTLKQVHTQPVKDAFHSLERNGHGKGILGIIVSAEGLTLDQEQRAKIWKNHKIVFWIKSGQATQMSCRELASKFPTGTSRCTRT